MMRGLFNLSFRYKIPLWGGFLIVATALIISTTLIFGAYHDLERDLLRNATTQGETMAHNLAPAILQDHVWQAYELVRAPLRGASHENSVRADSLVVLDQNLHVFVSTRPDTIPMLADFRQLSAEYRSIADDIAGLGTDTAALEPPGSDYLIVATPIVDEQTRLGTLLQIYSEKVLLQRFLESAEKAAWVTFLVLAVLLPINWYWGRRTATPLLRLTERMEQLGSSLPAELPTQIYDYQDELGRLFQAYNRTLQQLREKTLIEREVIQSERLVALGRLAAGIAHEINNPLLGMITSINTLRHHGEPDARTTRTLNLLERGLTQIKETVAALLVEAKINSRDFSPQDIDDLRTLITPQAQKRSVTVTWQSELTTSIPLPSTLVRQVLINLILNAVQATDEGSAVQVGIKLANEALSFEIINGGKILTESQNEHLFEPFINAGETGRGLGLWVCYQIVRQLGGNIAVDSAMQEVGGVTRFSVSLPLNTLS